jgi:hypothetical protein
MKDGYISQYDERNYTPRIKKMEKKDLPKPKIPVEKPKVQVEEIKEILQETYWKLPSLSLKPRKKKTKNDPS